MARNNDPIFWPDEEFSLHLRQTRDKYYDECINILQTQWTQADLDQRCAMGESDLWGQLFPGVNNFRRKMFNFNITNPHIQMISGYQRRNRKSSIVIPIANSNQKTADQLTKCQYHVHNRSGAYQVYSDAFELGAVTQGLGFVSIYNSLRDDPISGDICLRYIDMKACLFDPFFRRHDMSDARYWWTRQFFDRQEAALLYPDLHDKIMSMPRGNYNDGKFYYMPEVFQIQFPDLVAVDEYWYLSTRKAHYIIDTQTEEAQEYKGDEEELRDILSMFKGRLKQVTKPKQTIRRAIFMNDRVVLDEPDPNSIDRYPVVPFLGYFQPDTPYYGFKFRGIVRDLRDPNYLFNRLKVSDLDTIESQQQGLKIKKGALVTPDDSLNTGNGRVLVLDPKAQMTDVEQMQIIPPSPVRLEMENMLKEVMSQISGVNETMLGTDLSDKAGIISMLRTANGMTTLTKFFDQFDESQRLCSEIINEMVQQNWTYGKVKQVIGEEPTNEFDNKLFLKYGCKVIQGALTETQQQLELGQLLHLREILGDNTPPVVINRIIDAMYITGKDELKEQIEEYQKGISEQQNKRAELEMTQLQVDNATKIGYAHSQEALAQERTAKIQTDVAIAQDKLKRANQEDTHALLNLIKGIKELEGMDIEHLQQRLNIVKDINEDNIANQERIKKENQEVSYERT